MGKWQNTLEKNEQSTTIAVIEDITLRKNQKI
jgi:hypothetical protein